MNYNIIYDCTHKKYYDINSREGTELIDKLNTIIETHTENKNKNKKNKNINKTYFNEKKYTLDISSLGHMKCKLFYPTCSEKKTCSSQGSHADGLRLPSYRASWQTFSSKFSCATHAKGDAGTWCIWWQIHDRLHC